ncbi:hypothetical protein [Streptomyces sp. NPDC051569]|uniref:hypothetical protein n=1 Tax=Streptomyces sp. NPDC051569 TaxID=3365661 RepID=UPI0037A587A9
MAFPDGPLDVHTELQVGGAWTNISASVYTRDPITISYGRPDEGTRVDPGRCTLTLNNRDGTFSPRNPRSPYYGRIGRNTPLRVWVPGTESYLAPSGLQAESASTPSVPALGITGDLDLRVEVTADWYLQPYQVLMGKWTDPAQRSWALSLNAGTLELDWSTNGTVIWYASRPLPALPPRAALRVTLDVDNGTGGSTSTFYAAESLAGPWTQFGDPVVITGTTSVFASTAPLTLAPYLAGTLPLTGRIHAAEVRNGIGGTVAASPDFRPVAPGTPTFTDSAGRAWTVTSPAEITNREPRFQGEVSAWPPRWDVSGEDVYTQIEAAGVLRRYGQGRKALDSTLARRIPSAPGLVAYWPMEDQQGSTQAYSPVPGVRPLTVSGLDWAADDTLGGSSPLPKTRSPASLSAVVPSTTAAGWQTELVYFLPALPAVQTEVLRVTVTGSVMRSAVVYASTAGIRIEARDSDDSVLAFFLYTGTAALADFIGKWNRLAIYVRDGGAGQLRLTAAWRDIVNNSWWRSTTTVVAAMGRVSAINGTWGNALTGMVLGHLSVVAIPANANDNAGSVIYDGADSGFAGESAIDRLVRLAQEEPHLALSVIDGDRTRAAELMGPQRPAALLDLLQACAESDGGILHENREALALVYRDRTSLYNQRPVLTLDYAAAGEVAPPLEPTEDDQHLRNDITIQRDGGSSGRAVIETGPLSVLPPEQGGVGLYDESVTLSLATDDQPLQIAAWRAVLGTVDEARYPTVHLQLHTAPHLISSTLRLRIGDKGVIRNPPPWLPPEQIEFLVYGYTEVLDMYTWDITMNTVPARPWTVGVISSDPVPRADTDGTVLNGALSVSSAVVNVNTTSGPRWVDSATYASEFPFDIRVGGEVMRVTSCTGTALSQTFGVTRSINGISKAHPSGTAVQLATPTIVAL